MTNSRIAHAAMPLRDDNPSDIDLLGFEDVVDVVESIITRPDLDPVTVGVNAPWGGGKTTVLQLLKRRLDAHEDIFCLLVSPWSTTTRPTLRLRSSMRFWADCRRSLKRARVSATRSRTPSTSRGGA